MRLVTFQENESERLGVLVGESVVDLSKAAPDLPRSLVTLINAGQDGFVGAERAAKSAPAAARIPLARVQFLPPVTQPGKIICLGLNYVDHATEGGHAKPSYPSFFMRVATSLTGHGKAIMRPQCSTQLDYEAELAVVIGRTARHVRESNALGCVAGYSCFNDGSIRDYQRKTGQWTIGKNFDGTGGFGPWMVTPDELPAGAAGLSIQSRLNGQVMQNANTRDMLFPVAETIVLLTECLTLEPGDVIVMGTPAGVGHARKPPVWMKHGDTVEIEIEGIGVLSNPIRDESPAA
jgi:2-keto-4-pentenoate hydratase/2-oxohepta-3-ene-1,7-dioic acid hydratase in catechol pathway